jgi:hypothetical protein
METGKKKRLWAAGSALFVLGLLLRAGVEYYFPSMYWGDEVYQTLEPAHRLVFGYGRVMWEYSEGLRSWVFPGILAAVMWVGQFFGEGSVGYLATITLFLALVSLIPPLVTYLWGRREWGDTWWPIVAMLFPLLWFENLYFAAKSLYGSFTIHVVIGGIYLVRFAEDRWIRPFIAGALIGVCIITRPHLVPVAVVLAACIPIRAEKPHVVFSGYVAGMALGTGVAGIVDAIAYGVPFHSLIVNLHTNIIEGKASEWGEMAWWQYFSWMWTNSPVGAVGVCSALLAGTILYPTLALPALALLGAHMLIPHKEYRFFYPVLAMATMLVGLGVVRLAKWIAGRLRVRYAKSAVVAALLVIWTGASVYGALHFRLGSAGHWHDHLNWNHRTGKLRAYRYLSTLDICGLGRVGFWEIKTGGYAYLHHDVHIPPLEDAEAVRKHRSGYNAFVVDDWERESFAGFRRDRCFLNTCVYVREGDCD